MTKAIATKAKELAAALESHGGTAPPGTDDRLKVREVIDLVSLDGLSFTPGEYAWRDDEDSFFAPQPLEKFTLEQMGIQLYKHQLGDLHEILGNEPKMLFERGNGLPDEGVLCYGKGSGKDLMVSCFMVWAAHILLCLKNPAVYLGQAHGEPIDIITVAYTQLQAKSVLFFKIKQRLKSSGWFNGAIARLVPNIPPERYLKDGNGYVNADNIIFPGNVRLWSLPATDAAEGKNPILWCTDEIAAFSSETRKNQASHIHRILRSSARSRFGDRWKGFHISYPRHGEDYLMDMIGKSQKGLLPNVYAVVRPTWEVNERVTRESLQPDYDADPEGALCAYECKPPAAVDAFFRSPEYLLLNASGAPMQTLKLYLDLPDDHLSALSQLGRDPIRESDRYGDPVLDRHGFPKLHRWFQGQRSPEGEPYEYFAHLDPGLSGDAFGFCMGHLHRSAQGIFPVLDLCFRWTGRMFKGFGPIQRVGWFSDTQDQTEAIAAAEVDFRTVREFLFYLRQARGFDFGMVSFDGWNSAESVQELRKRDVPVVKRTVKKEDYDEFKTLVYNRQLKFYGWPILVSESRKLQLVNGARVEAPRTTEGAGKGKGKGSGKGHDSHKDVSDAAAAVCWRLVRLKDESTEFYQFPPVEDIWERSQRQDELVQVDATPEQVSEHQQRVLDSFFHGTY